MPIRVKPTIYQKRVDGLITVRRKSYTMTPARVIRCRVCGDIILRKKKGKVYSADEVLGYMRRHYKKSHPRKFREMIERGVKARTERYKLYKRTSNLHNPCPIRIGGIIKGY